MFNLPNFNPALMSDDAILEKIAELNNKINIMSYSSNGGSEMMMLMLEAFQNEYSERQFMEKWKRSLPFMSKTIETEPDLKKQLDAQEELKKEKPKRKRFEIPMRSDKPIIPDKD